MRAVLASLLVFFLQQVCAAPPVEIDPNTKIQGGADPRGSGAAAGSGMRRDSKMDTEPRTEPPGNNARGPDRTEPDKDKPFSERKPREEDRQYPAKEPAIPQR